MKQQLDVVDWENQTKEGIWVCEKILTDPFSLFSRDEWMKQGGNAAAQGTKTQTSFLHGNSDKLSRNFKVHARSRRHKVGGGDCLLSFIHILLIYVRHPSTLLVSVISTTHKGYQIYQHHSFSSRLQDLT